MNREILFKAKQKNWRELPKEEWWVEGNYYEAKISGCYILVPKLKIRKRDGVVIGDSFDVCEIDPQTLCQYTGLIDKNDKRIWENDIVLCESGEACMGYREFRETILVDSISNWQTMQILSECEDLKRLGNVFDNPELLGGAV